MDIKVYTNTVKLLNRISDTSSKTVPIISYTPQKPAYTGKMHTAIPLERTAPESEGISSDYLARFIRALRDEKSIDMHSVTVIRNSNVLCECYYGAYEPDVRRVMHSMCKSITALAIGRMIDRGQLSLDDRVVKLLDRYANHITALPLKNLTVRHLLTMSSGVMFNEAGSVTETEWIKGFLESMPRFELGKEFNYNSMNSYILSAIVKEVTGQQLTEYLKKPVFDELGMGEVYWEKSPEGIEKGGWGLYILPEDMAKIGLLYLNGGVYNGKRIISKEFISEATRAHIKAPEGAGDYDYGYHVWVGKNTQSFLLNGMFGQNVLGYKDKNIIIVTTAGNEEMFQQSKYYKIADKFFGNGFIPADPAYLIAKSGNGQALRELRMLCDSHGSDSHGSDSHGSDAHGSDAHGSDFHGNEHIHDSHNSNYHGTELYGAKKSAETSMPQSIFARLFTRRKVDLTSGGSKAVPKALPDMCARLNGRKYALWSKRIVGLLPLMTQSIQNNFTGGIDSIEFSVSGANNDEFSVVFAEGGEIFRVPVGFGGEAKYATLNFSGEKYRVGTAGRFAENEDGVKCLVMRLSFVEIPNSRIIKLFFDDEDTVTAKFAEKPNIEFVSRGLDAFLEDMPGKKIINALAHKVDGGYLLYRVSIAFMPEVRFIADPKIIKAATK